MRKPSIEVETVFSLGTFCYLTGLLFLFIAIPMTAFGVMHLYLPDMITWGIALLMIARTIRVWTRPKAL